MPGPANVFFETRHFWPLIAERLVVSRAIEQVTRIFLLLNLCTDFFIVRLLQVCFTYFENARFPCNSHLSPKHTFSGVSLVRSLVCFVFLFQTKLSKLSGNLTFNGVKMHIKRGCDFFEVIGEMVTEFLGRLGLV